MGVMVFALKWNAHILNWFYLMIDLETGNHSGIIKTKQVLGNNHSCSDRSGFFRFPIWAYVGLVKWPALEALERSWMDVDHFCPFDLSCKNNCAVYSRHRSDMGMSTDPVATQPSDMSPSAVTMSPRSLSEEQSLVSANCSPSSRAMGRGWSSLRRCSLNRSITYSVGFSLGS